MSRRKSDHVALSGFKADILANQITNWYQKSPTEYYEQQQIKSGSIADSGQQGLPASRNVCLPGELRVRRLIGYLRRLGVRSEGDMFKESTTTTLPTTTDLGAKPLSTTSHRIWIESGTVVIAGWGEAHSNQNDDAVGSNPSCAFQTKRRTGFTRTSSRSKRNCLTSGKQRDRDDEDQPPHPPSKTQSNVLVTSRPFACPFYLRDKERNGDCLHRKFKRIVDVRQHIYRHHVQPSYCPRCGIEFQDDPVYAHRDAHIGHCEAVNNVMHPAGATSEQLELMNTAAENRGRGATNVGRWYAIWDIMFPDVERPPSPFIDVSWEWDHLGFCATIDRCRQNGVVEEFIRLVGVDASGVLNWFLDYLCDHNASFIGTSNSHPARSIHTDMVTEFQSSRANPPFQMSSNLIPLPTVPSAPALRVLAPRPPRADSTNTEWALPRQDPNVDGPDNELDYRHT